jgi:hypothetical protein
VGKAMTGRRERIGVQRGHFRKITFCGKAMTGRRERMAGATITVPITYPIRVNLFFAQTADFTCVKKMANHLLSAVIGWNKISVHI